MPHLHLSTVSNCHISAESVMDKYCVCKDRQQCISTHMGTPYIPTRRVRNDTYTPHTTHTCTHTHTHAHAHAHAHTRTHAQSNLVHMHIFPQGLSALLVVLLDRGGLSDGPLTNITNKTAAAPYSSATLHFACRAGQKAGVHTAYQRVAKVAASQVQHSLNSKQHFSE